MSQSTYILIQRHFPIGGIESLICRAANLLAKKGNKVFVCARPGRMTEQLASNVTFIPLQNLAELPKRVASKVAPDASDIAIITFNPIGLIASYPLARKLRGFGLEVRLFSGVYHPRAYFWPTDGRITQFVYKKFFFSLPPDAVTFMNLDCLGSHAEYWKKDLTAYSVFRLPVEEKAPKIDFGRKNVVTITSVGRLVAWKAYNLGIASAAKKLSAAGISFKWEVWGDGPISGEMKEDVERHDLASFVELKGRLDYSDLEATVRNSDIFVGMGTAAVEAAICGVPTVLTIDRIRDSTPGYLHQVPGECVGESYPGMDLKDIGGFIISHFQKSEEEIEAIGLACREAAIAKSSGMDEVVKVYDANVQLRRSTPLELFAAAYIQYYDFRQNLAVWRRQWRS